jgi:purine-binding chemotaxis protein CheW
MTRKKEERSTHLAEPEQAVYEYLDSLLKEVGQAPSAPTATAEVVEIRPEPPAEEQQEVIEPEPAAAVEEEAVEAEPEEGAVVPEWAEEPFQCLLFSLRGMTLAVPLLSLDSIMKWEEEISPLPGQPDWHMGIALNRGQQVVVVDTAQLLVPDKLGRAGEEREKGSHILVIGGGSRGLACDSLAKPVTLTKEDVRWSSAGGNRPWVAGTIVEKLCILLNIESLLEMIGHE